MSYTAAGPIITPGFPERGLLAASPLALPVVITQEPTVPGKECRRCNLFKQATEFYRNKTNPDGLYNNCKSCFASDAWSRCVKVCHLHT